MKVQHQAVTELR